MIYSHNNWYKKQGQTKENATKAVLIWNQTTKAGDSLEYLRATDNGFVEIVHDVYDACVHTSRALATELTAINEIENMTIGIQAYIDRIESFQNWLEEDRLILKKCQQTLNKKNKYNINYGGIQSIISLHETQLEVLRQLDIDLEQIKQSERYKLEKVASIPNTDKKKLHTIQTMKPSIHNVKQIESTNYFRVNKDYCQICFNGNQLPPLKTHRGYLYIAYLIHKKDLVVDATELVALGRPERYRKKKQLSKQELISKENIKSCNERIDQIDNELSLAEKNCDHAAIDRLNNERQTIINELKSVTTPLGGLKKFSDDVSRDYGSAKEAIRRDLIRINEEDSELYTHLKLSIPRGTLMYCPKQSIEWDVSLFCC